MMIHHDGSLCGPERFPLRVVMALFAMGAMNRCHAGVTAAVVSFQKTAQRASPGDGQSPLHKGLMGKVVHRACGERGITHIKFGDLPESAVVMCKDFKKLAIVLSEVETGIPHAMECTPQALKVGAHGAIFPSLAINPFLKGPIGRRRRCC